MKKIVSLLTALLMLLTMTAFAEETSALDAFNVLTGQDLTTTEPALTFDKTPAQYLDDVMTGKYNVSPIDDTNAPALAADLDALSAITTADIADFALNNAFPEAQVRHGYFMALANVLRAEIMVDPASEDTYRNIQIILSLFLEDSDEQLAETSRNAIRSSMTREYAEIIAANYSLPTSFVEFVIMDDDWDDDDWQNDDDWVTATGYNWSYHDTPEHHDTPAAYDTPNVTPAVTAAPVYADTPEYYNTPDHNTPDHNTPDHNTPDYNTPDYNTPDHNTPDYDTPDYHTPDHNTPDYHDSPDHDSPDHH